jgi:hypothetical protein
MTSIIFHVGVPNTQENVSYILEFYVSPDVHFSRFKELKNTFSNPSNSLNCLTLMCSPPIDKYKFHSRGDETQENVSYVLDYCVSADVHFSNFD